MYTPATCLKNVYTNLTNIDMTKFRYSTNWMGPVSIDWYSKRGLTIKKTVTLDENSIRVKIGEGNIGDKIEIEEITERYSCGRIDVRGGDTGPYGDEIGVLPMRSEDWSTFGAWLETFETDDMWNLKQLVLMYERFNPKIRWADGITI